MNFKWGFWWFVSMYVIGAALDSQVGNKSIRNSQNIYKEILKQTKNRTCLDLLIAKKLLGIKIIEDYRICANE